MSFRERAREWIEGFNEAAAARQDILLKAGFVETSDRRVDHIITPAHGTMAVRGYMSEQPDKAFYDAEVEGWFDQDNQELA